MTKSTKTVRPSERHLSGRKILAVCLALLGLFLIADTIIRHIGIVAVTAVQTSETPARTLRISPGAWERHEILPPASMDARWWVINTEQLLKGGALRVRQTDLDNAPYGREVHWSSGLVWLLAVLSIVISSITGKPAADCVVQATFWAGPLLLIGASVLLGFMVARRFGIRLAGIFALVFGTSPLIYQGFRAGEADHHGIVLAFAASSVLALVAAGGGLVRRGDKRTPAHLPLTSAGKARKWFVLSGIFGGAALWISAASFIPVLVGCGIGSLAILLLRDREVSVAAPDLWRIWGAAGCAASIFFYLVEYFPGHMGWRLEVNHPLYALAWLGAGDLLARFLAKLSGGKFLPRGIPSGLWAAGSLTALALPVTLIALWPHLFFWVSDQFLLQLHKEFIQEFQSLPRLLDSAAALVPVSLFEFFAWPVFVLAGTLILRFAGNLSRSWQALLGLALAPALVMQSLAFVQIRWCILAMGLWLICGVILLAAHDAREGRPSRLFQAAFAAVVLLNILLLPVSSFLALSQAGSIKNNMPKAVIPTVLARDVSHRLIQSSPDQLPVVLSGPTTSTELAYYGGIATLGTLYWENLRGLERAAHIFAAPGEERARELIEKAGVTHIVVSTWDNFGVAYVKLLRMSGVTAPPLGESFVEKMLKENSPPDWLRPLYYPIPPGFDIRDEELRIYLFAPYQTPAEALFHRGVYLMDASDFAGAEKLLAKACVLDPLDSKKQRLLELSRDELSRQN